MSDQEEQTEYHPPNPEDYEPFLNCLETLINNPQQRTHQNILDYEKGVINFDVEYRSLHNKQIQLQISDNKKVQTPLYNNHHYGPLKNHNMFEDLQTPSTQQISQEVDNSIISNIIYPEVKKQVFGNKEKCAEIEQSLKDQMKNQYLQDFSLKDMNGFTPTYQFDILNGDFKNCNYDMINPDFKNFSFETSTKGQFINKTSIYKRNKQEKVANFSDLEKEFQQLSEGIASDFKFEQEKQKQEGIKKNENLQELAQENLKIIKILSLNSSKWDDQDDESKKAFQRTFGEEDNYELLWNQICHKLKKNKSAEEEEKLQDEQEIQQGGAKNFLQVLENLKLTQLDEFEEMERQEKERKEAFENAVDVDSKFRIIRLTGITGGTVGCKSSNSDLRWASEDEADLETFYDRLPREKFAMDFPFELDTFQKRAILRLENRESVLVCAHTSAGKTVVAEYAIALSQRHKRRCIYTSPIKALSNEKYRKLSKRFDGDVGIITGDVTLNPQASCLIVTTEILRNMLYKGNDMIRDIEWVIFDEVHYINNAERGVVWEETIIMLPDHINIVMLSATIPNHMDFANWVGRTKRRQINVQKTFWRPVPLEHSIYIFNKFHIVKEKEGPFLEDEYAYLKDTIGQLSQEDYDVMAIKKKEKYEKQEKGTYKDKSRGRMMANATKNITRITKGDLVEAQYKDERRNLYELLTHCKKNDLLPAVIFIFSKNKILELSQGLAFMDLVTKQEESRILRYFDHALKKLKPKDQCLPQLVYLRSILRKGIAVHHGDLIPIAKEIVEILFSEGLIKVLLATETFAMGLNMPTKTVVFFSLKKHDGKERRYLNSSEYTQMAGRAGRRGLDEKGNVIIYISDPNHLPEKHEMFRIIAHKGEQIKSKFKITYEVILNKLNSKELNVIDMMRSSFSENDKFSQLPKNLLKIKNQKQEYIELSDFQCKYVPKAITNTAPIEEYHEIAENLRDINQDYWDQDFNFIKKLQLPKFVMVMGYNNALDLGVLLQHNNKGEFPFEVMLVTPIMEQQKGKKIILEYEDEKTLEKGKKVRDQNYIFKIMAFPAHEIVEIFDDKLQIGKGASQKLDLQNNNILSDIATLLIDKLDYFSEQQIMDFKKPNKSKTFVKPYIKGRENQDSSLRDIKNLTQLDFVSSKCHDCELLPEHLGQIQKREKLQKELEQLIRDVDENSLNLTDNFNGRVDVLKSLRYVDETNQPLIKASIGRELGDQQIYMCELIVENIIGDLEPQEIASLLSGFVCQYKSRKGYDKKHLLDDVEYNPRTDDTPFFSDEFVEAAQETYNIVERIIKEEAKYQVIMVGERHEYINDNVLNFSLAKVIHDWCTGKDFIDIMKKTDAQEGTIIRTIMRLENLLKNFKSAAKIIGHMPLSHKLDVCMDVIRRDIVFTQSLYYEDDKQNI